MNDRDQIRLQIMLELCAEIKVSLVKHDYSYQEYLDDASELPHVRAAVCLARP